MKPPGLWRFSPGAIDAVAEYPWPYDVDDTALGSMAFRGSRLSLLLRRNVGSIVQTRDASGLFLTWMVDSPYRSPVCAVTNANVVWYLGERPETTEVIRWLSRIAVDGTELQHQTFYPEPMHFAYAVSRAAAGGAIALRAVGGALVTRVEAAAAGGTWAGSALGAAQALCTLCRSGARGHPLIEVLATHLVGTQAADGSWPAAPAWSARLSDVVRGIADKPLLHWGSRSLTTAVALEALALL